MTSSRRNVDTVESDQCVLLEDFLNTEVVLGLFTSNSPSLTACAEQLSPVVALAFYFVDNEPFFVAAGPGLVVVVYLNPRPEVSGEEFATFLILIGAGSTCRLECSRDCLKYLRDRYAIFLGGKQDMDEERKRVKAVFDHLKKVGHKDVEGLFESDYQTQSESKWEQDRIKAVIEHTNCHRLASMPLDDLKLLAFFPYLMFLIERERYISLSLQLPEDLSTPRDQHLFQFDEGRSLVRAVHMKSWRWVTLWKTDDVDSKLKILKDLSHPGLLKVYGKCEGEVNAVVLEPILKWDVVDVWDGPKNELLVLSHFTDLVFALNFVHENGYAFRSFPGENVVAGMGMRCKLCFCDDCVEIDRCPGQLRESNVAALTTLYGRFMCRVPHFRFPGCKIEELMVGAIEANLLTLNPSLLDHLCELLKKIKKKASTPRNLRPREEWPDQKGKVEDLNCSYMPSEIPKPGLECCLDSLWDAWCNWGGAYKEFLREIVQRCCDIANLLSDSGLEGSIRDVQSCLDKHIC